MPRDGRNVMDDVQVGMSVAITKEALDFQAAMSANIINGSFEKMAEMRGAGLAAQGIGQNIDISV